MATTEPRSGLEQRQQLLPAASSQRNAGCWLFAAAAPAESRSEALRSPGEGGSSDDQLWCVITAEVLVVFVHEAPVRTRSAGPHAEGQVFIR